MIKGILPQRVDLEKLTQEDLLFRGEFRATDENYHRWKKKPEFQEQGTETYVSFDQLFLESKFNECYELIVQTPQRCEVVGTGYLHKSREGDVNFGVRSTITGKHSYSNSSPV